MEPVDGQPNGALASAFGSIARVAWSTPLALRAPGLGSAWTALHLFREDRVAQLAGIPEGVTQATLLPVACAVGTDFKPASRSPVRTITFLDSSGGVAGLSRGQDVSQSNRSSRTVRAPPSSPPTSTRRRASSP